MAYNGDLAEQFRRLVLKNEPLCLAYCTMVKLTASFNASFLLFRQTEFVEAPVIPLVVVIHQQMTADTHSIFWQNVAQHFPELKSEGVTYLVTGDRSQDMVDAVARSFPHMEVFRCVNHVLDDTNNKLKSMADLRAEDVIIYEEEVKMLFSQTSRLQYMEKLTSCMISWHRVNIHFLSYDTPYKPKGVSIRISMNPIIFKRSESHKNTETILDILKGSLNKRFASSESTNQQQVVKLSFIILHLV